MKKMTFARLLRCAAVLAVASFVVVTASGCELLNPTEEDAGPSCEERAIAILQMTQRHQQEMNFLLALGTATADDINELQVRQQQELDVARQQYAEAGCGFI